MLYTLTLDNDGYVLSISHTKNDNVDIDIELIDIKYLGAYKLTENGLILDEAKRKEMIEAEQRKAKDIEIQTLKKQLNDTDYIMAETFESIMALNNPVTFIADFIKVLVDFKQKYSEAIENRKLWRQRIKDLEG